MTWTSGYLKFRAVRRTEHGLEYEIEARTWHPSWWALCWRMTVDFVRERYVDRGVSLLVAFVVALWLFTFLLAKTVRL